ncbi:MAG: hypothetical protein ABW171_09475, partial [Steroidobacter sp.]
MKPSPPPSQPLHTPDRRYIVVRGRLWRASNPKLSAKVRERLVRELMRARLDVKHALHAKDAVRLKQARNAVNAAKIALGERGPVWWDDGLDFHRRLVKNTPYAQWYLHLAAA